MITSNKVQINYSEDRTPDGKITRKTLLCNIRENSVGAAVELYRQLKEQLDKPIVQNGSGNIVVKKETLELENIPECSTHHVPMIKRTRKDTGSEFWGCGLYWSRGCLETSPSQIRKQVPAQTYFNGR